MTAGRDLGFSRYDEMAKVFGAHGEFVERPEDIRPALERAVASGKPAVVNVITDPSARSSTQSFAAYRANLNPVCCTCCRGSPLWLPFPLSRCPKL